MFERFYRADPARTTGGTGLGLAIVAALVSAHGGATWVKSQPGEGATFCIALPLAPEAVLGADDDHDEEPDAGGATAWNGPADETGPADQNGPFADHELRRPWARLIASRRQDRASRTESGVPVRAAEQADVHQQRMQLMQRHPDAPPVS